MSFARTAGRTNKPPAATGKATVSTSLPPVAKQVQTVSSRWAPTVKSTSLHAAHSSIDFDAASLDDDDPLDDSLDDAAWEDEVRSRQSFLHGLIGTNDQAAASTQAVAAVSSAATRAQATVPAEPRGLDEDDEDEISPSAAVATHSPSTSSNFALVPSLFDLAVEQLGLNYATIAAQDVAERLPPGTLGHAIAAVRKAGLLHDTHMPLLFRTLTRSATVDSRTWLEQDCGLDALVSSSIDQDEDAPDVASPTPSTYPPPPTASTAAPTSASKVAPKPKSSPSSSPTIAPMNTRFAPLRGTPGVTSGHSMNTATLARAAKAAKVAAQIAAENLQPMAKPRVKPAAQVTTQRSKPTGATRGVIPKDYLLATGEFLDLHAQFKISEYGFKLLTGFMAYTQQRANGAVIEEEEPTLTAAEMRTAEAGFTEEQRRRLASVGVSDELRALVRKAAPSSSPAPYSSSASAIPRPVIELAHRLGIWRAVNIINLDVSFSGLDTAGLQLIARQCPNLLKVNLCGCERITNAGVSDLARHCRQVQVLQMQVLPCLDDSAVQDVIHGMKQLLSLDVGSCRKIGNVSFQIIGSHGRALKRLSAAGCLQTTDFDVEDLAKCVSLLSLSLRACGKITDDSVTHLVTLSKRKKKAGMRGLQRLDIGGCVRLSDGSVNALCAAYAPSLSHLDLRGMTRLTDRCLDAITAHCFKAARPTQVLRELNIGACSNITPARIQAMRDAWPDLRLVD